MAIIMIVISLLSKCTGSVTIVGLETVQRNKKTNPNPSPSAVDGHPSTFNPSDSQIWSPQVISKDDHRKHS